MESKIVNSHGTRAQSPKSKNVTTKGSQQEKGGRRKNALNEIRRSVSRARDEHIKNLHEINRINDSVKYSPRASTHFDKDNLNQASIDDTEENSIGQMDYIE